MMAKVVKWGLAFAICILCAIGATVPLAESSAVKVSLFCLYLICNLFLANQLLAIPDWKQAIRKSVKKREPNWIKLVCGGIFLLNAFLVPTYQTFWESALWLLADIVCYIAICAVVISIVRRFLK
ncbi:hypothetical protein IWT25_02080 [Secundilactobacillus pentosiphilus]|uniref:Uncharacterized protein n=1 Tax=Secundilactobacillus pentosiphilus TaxID=1714682 RepID=A0A1Z5IY73_9LACO|nr:hypothetical protein [Secundilactobacillus pentosiphilus]GAX06733.1 hypothetical protein IWT25_02080 [Secundilactobacillus pentosiphilus]